MSAMQCPDCDLRFASERDLDDHLKLDHPEFHIEPKTPEDGLLMERRHAHRRHRPEPRNG